MCRSYSVQQQLRTVYVSHGSTALQDYESPLLRSPFPGSSHLEYLHDFVAEMVDDFYGNTT